MNQKSVATVFLILRITGHAEERDREDVRITGGEVINVCIERVIICWRLNSFRCI